MKIFAHISTASQAFEIDNSPSKTQSFLTFLLPFFTLATAALLFRIPAFINAGTINSDAAVVGLQARHILQGELSPIIWNAGYQSSFEAFLLAGAFALFGATPMMVIVVPVIGYLLILAFTFDILRRRLGPWSGFWATALLIFTSQAVFGITVSVPRQWAITAIFAGLWFLDRAENKGHAPRWYFVAAFLAIFGIYLDGLVLLFIPGFIYLAWACTQRSKFSLLEARKNGRALLFGAGVGFAIYLFTRLVAAGGAGAMSLSPHVLPRNIPLLFKTCLHILLGTKIFIPGNNLYPDLWLGPTWLQVIRWIGGLSLLFALGYAGYAYFQKKIPWAIRRLGGFGTIVSACTLGGFVSSPMVVDMHSARYLGPIIWVAPFFLAPLAYRLGRIRFALFSAPILFTLAVTVWISFGPYVKGIRPVISARGSALEEQQVGKLLREQKVEAAMAQYWLAYRLSFLLEENPIVEALDGGRSRYAPYRQKALHSKRLAYIFHPSEPRAKAETYVEKFQKEGTSFERFQVADFIILIVQK